MAETPPPHPGQLKPHRGALILVLGILGLVVCFVLGIIAWVMGNNDLQEMEAGRMDPAGEGLTKAGKICGMVATFLIILGLIVFLVLMTIGGGLAIFGIA